MITSKKWWAAAGNRALKTFAQTLAGGIGSALVFSAVDWPMAFSAAGIAAVLSLLTSVAGLPELKSE